MNETVESAEVHAYTVPTDLPESDGTIEWSSTTLILVRLKAGEVTGLGYSYAHECCVPLIRNTLFPILQSKSIFSISALWSEMNAAVRNAGRRGIASSAIAAVEIALWDLKAKLLKLALVKLLGGIREKIPVYGSGGFTSYSRKELQRQMANWVGEGIRMVKMKVGRSPSVDVPRVIWAREVIKDEAELFVDANGAYSAKIAMDFALHFAGQDVSWFEEPVSSDDLDGLAFLRRRFPARIEIAAGEYNYDAIQAKQMLAAQAVDVLQADATRCGVTGFLQTAALCETFGIPLSAHTAPALHAHLCCATKPSRHVEYFHDHARIEQMFFEGATVRHKNGFLIPSDSELGLGLELKEQDISGFKVDI